MKNVRRVFINMSSLSGSPESIQPETIVDHRDEQKQSTFN